MSTRIDIKSLGKSQRPNNKKKDKEFSKLSNFRKNNVKEFSPMSLTSRRQRKEVEEKSEKCLSINKFSCFLMLKGLDMSSLRKNSSKK